MSSRSLASIAALLLLLAGLVCAPSAAVAQDAYSGDAAGLHVSVSPEQARQIISAKLLQDGIAVGLQSLRQQMNLTPAQELRWRAFILTCSAEPQGVMLGTITGEDSTPLRQAQANLALQREQLAFETRRVRSMERLYKTLDDRQRAVFDQGLAMIGTLSVSTQAVVRASN
jgi:hypothetical protein